MPKERKEHRPQTEETVGEVVLRFLEGENEGVEIRVTPPRKMTMGRSEACDIFLGEKKISRKHCEVEVTPSAVRLIDLQSTNGTFLNGKKVSGDVPLGNGDKIRCGNSVIQVEIHTEKALQAAAPEEAEAEDESISTGELPKKGDLKPPPPPADSISGLELNEPSGVADLASEESFARNFGLQNPVSLNEVEISEPRVEPPIPPPLEKKPKHLSGNLSAMGLADLLQNLSQNQKSGNLRLKGPREGRVTMVQGKLLGAEVGIVHGPKALYRMLGWHEGEFELLPLPEGFKEAAVEHPIKESIEQLLMEGFRQFDELEKLKKGLPPFSAKLRMRPHFTAPLSKLHPRVLDILQIILNEEEFQAVMDKSPISDLEVAKIVFYLIKKEYVVST